MIAADRNLDGTLDVLLALYVGKSMLDRIEVAEIVFGRSTRDGSSPSADEEK